MNKTKRRLTKEDLEENGYDIEMLGDPEVHPMVEKIENGKPIWRFDEKPIMKWISSQIDLNKMKIAFLDGEFSKEEYKQFDRDIGYSLCGFEEIWSQQEQDEEEIEDDDDDE